MPLNFPENYDVKDPFDALDISLKDMKHWELAPANPGATGSGRYSVRPHHGRTERQKIILDNLRKAIEYGLSEEAALKSLTFHPATFLGMYALRAMRGGSGIAIGSLEPGKLANFIITSGNVFKKIRRFTRTGCRADAPSEYAQFVRHIARTPGHLQTRRGPRDVHAYNLQKSRHDGSPDHENRQFEQRPP